MSLELINISKIFKGAGHEKGVHSLREIDFEIKDGQFISIIGPSGCHRSM